MAIVPVQKVTLYGPTSQKEEVVGGLQGLGCMHLVDLGGVGVEKRAPIAQDEASQDALQYLRSCSIQRLQVHDPEGFDSQQVCREVLALKDQSQVLEQENDRVEKGIADLEPWGDFERPPWARQGALRLWFYVVPYREVDAFASLSQPWRVVARDHRFRYIVVIAAGPPEGLPVAPITLPEPSLSTLKKRRQAIRFEHEDLEFRRIDHTRWIHLIERARTEADNRAAYEQARTEVFVDGPVFALQGWVPRALVSRVRDYAGERGLALTVADPGPGEEPPTLLENPPALGGGEDATTFYTVPGYRTWDPSLAVFFAFSIFFAMILADAGYGLVLGLILWWFWKPLSASTTGKRFRNLLLSITVCSLAYGIMTGSYFGVTPEGPPLAWLRVPFLAQTQANQGTLMLLSITIGVLHLSLANLARAWQLRDSLSLLAPVGWVAILLGGYTLGLALLGGNLLASGGQAILQPVGTACLVGGFVLVLLFTSQQEFSLHPRNLLGRLLEGVMGWTKLSSAFGDVLSYLRLFALGLASGMLASTFNNLASGVRDLQGPGPLLAFLILLLGHGLNFLLGLMSGVVHGLRLNCIEFFNWSLPEEGYLFRAFQKKGVG
jgi:V/A-type H+-transporting ATPase subunit I